MGGAQTAGRCGPGTRSGDPGVPPRKPAPRRPQCHSRRWPTSCAGTFLLSRTTPLDGRETVPNAMDCANHLFLAARIAQLSPDGTDVSLEEGSVIDVLVAPDLLGEEGVRKRLAGVSNELPEHIDLQRSQIQAGPAVSRGLARLVEFEPVRFDALGGPGIQRHIGPTPP